MARLGIVWRLGLILLAALIIVQLVTTGVYLWRRERASENGLFSPLADQVTAMVTLVDDAPAERRPLLLRAFNSPELEVTVEAAPDAAEGRALPAMERMIRDALPATPVPRQVSVQLIMGERSALRRPRLLSRFVDGRVVASIALAGGGFLIAETNGELMPRLFGLQPGFFAGIFGLLVAILAIAFFTWEARPIRRLSKAVQAFGRDATPKPEREAGAAEVRVLIRAFNEMQQRLAGLIANRAFVLGAMAHDLRTYLTRLRLRAEFIGDEGEKAAWVRNLDAMQQLVEDTLTFAKVSFGADRAARSDLARLARREIDERAALGADVRGTLPSAPVMVAGSETALARALANLVDNAVKYGGSAEITLTVDKTRALLAVEDRGPGLPADLRHLLAQPFQQGDQARTRGAGGGAGLGLAIAREIASGLGGELQLGDRPGGGARLVLALPLAGD